MVRVGASSTWDSNVFRLGDAVNPKDLGIRSKADRFTAAYGGLSIDKLYGQQRFFLDASETAYRYDKLSSLNFDAFQYRAGWDWHLSPRIAGSLTADRSQSLVNYADFRGTQRNLHTIEDRRLSADAWLFGGWHLLAAALEHKSVFSAPFVQQPGYRSTAGEAAVKYAFVSGSSLAFGVRSVRGRFVDQVVNPVLLVDDGFRQTEREALATWLITGRSTIDGRVARIDYRSNNFARRDFSGTVGKVGYRWASTAKLALDFSASRELSPWTDPLASYRVEDRLSLGAGWDIAAKVRARMTLYRSSIDYRKPIVTSFSGPLRHDTFRGSEFALEWKPLRNATVSASLQQYRRTSTGAPFQFKGNLVSLGVSLMF
jgi:exopolysaccharide biosynthesis operon protein EpsL